MVVLRVPVNDGLGGDLDLGIRLGSDLNLVFSKINQVRPVDPTAVLCPAPVEVHQVELRALHLNLGEDLHAVAIRSPSSAPSPWSWTKTMPRSLSVAMVRKRVNGSSPPREMVAEQTSS